jgi:hypothetical protein
MPAFRVAQPFSALMHKSIAWSLEPDEAFLVGVAVYKATYDL